MKECIKLKRFFGFTISSKCSSLFTWTSLRDVPRNKENRKDLIITTIKYDYNLVDRQTDYDLEAIITQWYRVRAPRQRT